MTDSLPSLILSIYDEETGKTETVRDEDEAYRRIGEVLDNTPCFTHLIHIEPWKETGLRIRTRVGPRATAAGPNFYMTLCTYEWPEDLYGNLLDLSYADGTPFCFQNVWGVMYDDRPVPLGTGEVGHTLAIAAATAHASQDHNWHPFKTPNCGLPIRPSKPEPPRLTAIEALRLFQPDVAAIGPAHQLLTTSDEPKTVEDAELTLLGGIPGHMGYKVGKSGKSVRARRKILDRILSQPLPLVRSEEYVDGWGPPASENRLESLVYWMSSQISLARRKRKVDMRSAIEDWEDDLEYLRERYYTGNYSFTWPDL